MLIKRSCFLLLSFAFSLSKCIYETFFQADYQNLLGNISPLDSCRLHSSGEKHFSSAVNGYNVCRGHNFTFRCTCALAKRPSSPTMQGDRFLPERNCWIIKCTTEAIKKKKKIHTLHLNWAKRHHPVRTSAHAGVLPGAADSPCSYGSPQKGRAMSRFQQGLFLPAAGLHGTDEAAAMPGSTASGSRMEAWPKLVRSLFVWT